MPDQSASKTVLWARINALLAYTLLWRVALITSLIIITILSTVRIDGPAPVTGWDKLNHLIAFAELIVLTRLGWPTLSPLIAGIAVLAFGLLIEMIQAPLAYRSFSLLDLLADGLGVVIGLALVHGILGIFVSKAA